MYLMLYSNNNHCWIIFLSENLKGSWSSMWLLRKWRLWMDRGIWWNRPSPTALKWRNLSLMSFSSQSEFYRHCTFGDVEIAVALTALFLHPGNLLHLRCWERKNSHLWKMPMEHPSTHQLQPADLCYHNTTAGFWQLVGTLWMSKINPSLLNTGIEIIMQQ